MKESVTYTHKGWFGFCPIYVADIDSESPRTAERHPSLVWLMLLSEAVISAYIFIRSLGDLSFEPVYPILITGELKPPMTVEEEVEG